MSETTKASAVFRVSRWCFDPSASAVDAQSRALESESSHSPRLTWESRRLPLYDPGMELIMWDESSPPLLFSDPSFFFFPRVSQMKINGMVKVRQLGRNVSWNKSSIFNFSPCIVWKNLQVSNTARQVACHLVNNSRGKRSFIWVARGCRTLL